MAGLGDCLCCICARLKTIESKLDESSVDTAYIKNKVDILISSEWTTQKKVDEVLEAVSCECSECENYSPIPAEDGEAKTE